MAKPRKTTRKHFKFFRRECRYWLDKFHLYSWRIDFSHRVRTDLETGAFAWCDWWWKNHISEIGLSREIGQNCRTDVKVLSATAFHEVCHLLLSELHTNADIDARPSILDDNTRIAHTIIRRLEKSVWEPYWAAQKEKK